MTLALLLDAVRDLDFDVVSDRVLSVELPPAHGVPSEPAEARFAFEAGLFDLIAESASEPSEPVADRIERIESLLRRVQALVVVTRFALFERLEAAERQERGARMNGLDIDMTRTWMLPRLRQDIKGYVERIEALRRAIEETRG